MKILQLLMMEPLSFSPDASVAAEGQQAPLPSCHQLLGPLCPVPAVQSTLSLVSKREGPGHTSPSMSWGLQGVPAGLVLAAARGATAAPLRQVLELLRAMLGPGRTGRGSNYGSD